MGTRPLTDRERAGLKHLSGKSGQVAAIAGLMVLMFNGIFLIVGDPPKNVPFFYGVNLALLIVGFALAGETRRLRGLASSALAEGTAAEALAIARSEGGRTRVLDLGGARMRPAWSDRRLAGALSSDAALRLEYIGPFPQPQSPAVILLSLNGVSPERPVICAWSTNPGAG